MTSTLGSLPSGCPSSSAARSSSRTARERPGTSRLNPSFGRRRTVTRSALRLDRIAQRDPLQRSEVQFHARHDACRQPDAGNERVGRASRIFGALGPRVDRRGESQSQCHHGSLLRARIYASRVLGTIQEHDRSTHVARALSGWRTGSHRRAGTPGPGLLRHHCGCYGTHQGGEIARPCSHRRDTHTGPAEGSDHWRIRARL
jgi:hypothetical protein